MGGNGDFPNMWGVRKRGGILTSIVEILTEYFWL